MAPAPHRTPTSPWHWVTHPPVMAPFGPSLPPSPPHSAPALKEPPQISSTPALCANGDHRVFAHPCAQLCVPTSLHGARCPPPVPNPLCTGLTLAQQESRPSGPRADRHRKPGCLTAGAGREPWHWDLFSPLMWHGSVAQGWAVVGHRLAGPPLTWVWRWHLPWEVAWVLPPRCPHVTGSESGLCPRGPCVPAGPASQPRAALGVWSRGSFTPLDPPVWWGGMSPHPHPPVFHRVSPVCPKWDLLGKRRQENGCCWGDMRPS